MTIENTSEAHATLWIDEDMFMGMRCSKQSIDAGGGCSRSLSKIPLTLLPSTAVLVSCRFICSASLPLPPPLRRCENRANDSGVHSIVSNSDCGQVVFLQIIHDDLLLQG